MRMLRTLGRSKGSGESGRSLPDRINASTAVIWSTWVGCHWNPKRQTADHTSIRPDPGCFPSTASRLSRRERLCWSRAVKEDATAPLRLRSGSIRPQIPQFVQPAIACRVCWKSQRTIPSPSPAVSRFAPFPYHLYTTQRPGQFNKRLQQARRKIPVQDTGHKAHQRNAAGRKDQGSGPTALSPHP